MAGVRGELPAPVRFRAVELVRRAAVDQGAALSPSVAGLGLDEARELLIATARLAGLSVRLAARLRGESVVSTVEWLSGRLPGPGSGSGSGRVPGL